MLESPKAIVIDGEASDLLCGGNPQEALALAVGGGISPYALAWSNGSGAQNQTSLAAGIFEVTVTDANGCNALESFTVTEPASSLTSEGIVTNVLCFGESTVA